MAVGVGARRRGQPDTSEWLISAVHTVPESGCWLWSGCTDAAGYGMVMRSDKTIRVHRLSYEIHNGEIPDGLIVMHLCDTPTCCNPDHLKVGTKGENNTDRHKKLRTASKLSPDQVLSIYADKRNQSVVAREHGVHQCVISHIKAGKRWASLTGHKENASAPS